MIIDAFRSKAPKLPEYQARFRAIYLEPIVGSGERLTIGIMVQAKNGETKVLQAIPAQRLHCMYGENAKAIGNLVHIILTSADADLQSGLDIEAWQPPMEGASLGALETTYANNGMEGVLFQAITSYSSLYSGQLVDKARKKSSNAY